jgi:predicted polyphosphate/ATP-dependent NAD kinase
MTGGENKHSPRIGLIVNPIAGIGGRVGLKGSDGVEIQQQARALGAVPRAQQRTIETLEQLRSVKDLQVITYPGEMGADAAHACGMQPLIIGAIPAGATTGRDTQVAAREMRRLGVDLVLFAGGDGTARDIYIAIGDSCPALGIPAGVKIHSAVFGTNPRSAGELAAQYLQGRAPELREAEVMDIDEGAVRTGSVSAQLYGYLKIPYRHNLVQNLKSGSGPGEQAAAASIAAAVVDDMQEDWLYVLGPGTTTRAISTELGLEKTLLGVDVVRNKKLIASDVNETQLLELIKEQRIKIIVTPIGGQGYIFGRGNQQISPRVVTRAGRENIIVVSTTNKIYALGGRPLLVDTGERELDESLSGYVHIVTGYDQEMVYRVSF